MNLKTVINPLILMNLTVNCVVSAPDFPFSYDFYYFRNGSLFIECERDYSESQLAQAIDYQTLLYPGLQATIETISFKNCEFSQLPFSIFGMFSNLQRLDISDLSLKTVTPNNFVEIQRLAELNLSHNQIDQIEPSAFLPGNHVNILDLSYNNINELNVKTFQKLTEITHLFVSHNQIEKIPSFFGEKMKNLIEVDFSFNKIKKVEKMAFFGNSNVNKLNIAHNQLTSFDEEIAENVNLNALDISWNQITQIKPNALEKLHSLMDLNLSGNSIKQLENGIFTELVNLERLNLSRTTLSAIQPKTFSAQINLTILDLSNNEIEVLDANSFDILDQPAIFELIDLQNNPLREMNNFARIFHILSSVQITKKYKFRCSNSINDLTDITNFYPNYLFGKQNCTFETGDRNYHRGVLPTSNSSPVSSGMSTKINEFSYEANDHLDDQFGSSTNLDLVETSTLREKNSGIKLEIINKTNYFAMKNLWGMLCIFTIILSFITLGFSSLKQTQTTEKCQVNETKKYENASSLTINDIKVQIV